MRRDLSFKTFFEDDTKSMHKKKPQENYFDGMWRELGIDPNVLPEFIESGPIELEDEGLWFNQAIWQIIKPIDLSDTHVRIKFHKSLSPNLNQQIYRRREDGQMIPYHGDPSESVHLITLKKLADILGKGWQGAMQAGGMGGMM